jgi:HK97 family phage portal protein
MKINRVLSGALGARSISIQDVFDSGGDLTGLAHRGNHAGVAVDINSAAQLTAVFGSWRIISESVATLPRDLVESGDNGLPSVYGPRPFWLDQPSQFENWGEFSSQIVLSLLQTGNAFVLLDWGVKTGLLTQMKVLAPRLCRRVSREVVSVSNDSGVSLLPVFESGASLRSVEVMHIKGMASPGALEGLSPIMACAEALGISIAGQRYGASFFANDATPGGIIQVPAEIKLSESGRQATREAWSDMFGGPNRAKKVAVLTEGASYKPLQVTPNEAQFLESRKFGIQEIARIYGVPPHLLMDNAGTSGWGTAMAEQNTAFVTHTLPPTLERLESHFTALARRELGRGETVSLAIHEEALMRGATASRWDVLRKNVGSGLVTADEARLSEGLPPLADGIGSVPWVPLQQLPQLSDETVDEKIVLPTVIEEEEA